MLILLSLVDLLTQTFTYIALKNLKHKQPKNVEVKFYYTQSSCFVFVVEMLFAQINCTSQYQYLIIINIKH
jgi:p-aminobenzoyl-glutamate transporter AbgT